MMNNQILYAADFVEWTKNTAALLQKQQFEELDIAHLIEEIESLGRRDRNALASYLEVLLLHLLKWEYQEGKRSRTWKSSIRNSRYRIADLLEESPSLRRYLIEVLDKSYQRGRKGAAEETGIPSKAFPVICPYSVENLLNDDYYPTGE